MVKLQILDIGDDDVDFNYIITLYCKNDNDEDVVCHVKEFKPFFKAIFRNEIKSTLKIKKI